MRPASRNSAMQPGPSTRTGNMQPGPSNRQGQPMDYTSMAQPGQLSMPPPPPPSSTSNANQSPVAVGVATVAQPLRSGNPGNAIRMAMASLEAQFVQSNAEVENAVIQLVSDVIGSRDQMRRSCEAHQVIQSNQMNVITTLQQDKDKLVSELAMVNTRN